MLSIKPSITPRRRLFAAILVVLCSFAAQAQGVDSTLTTPSVKKAIKPDSLSAQAAKDSFPVPKKALLYAIIPGGGQIYNRKYWYIKVPVVYAGFGVGVYSINLWSNYYKNLKLNYYNKVNNLPLDNSLFPNIENVDADALRQNRDLAFKRLQQMYIFTGIWYLLSGMEAYTAAHLAHFDVKDDLSFHFKPSFEFIPLVGNSAGIGIQVRF